MGRSFLYDWGTGIGTNIIGAVLLAIVAIVWKYMKARRNSSMGQPENPVASGQFVIHITTTSSPIGGPLTISPIGGPPTSSPIGGPPTSSPIGGPPTSSPIGGPPTSSPIGGPLTISPIGGPPTSSPIGGPPTSSPIGGPPTSPTPSFGSVASISRTHGQEEIEPCVTDNESSNPPASPTPSFGTLSPKRGSFLPPKRGQVRMVRPKILKYLVESRQGLRHRRPIDHEL